MSARQIFTPEQKVAILREHLIEKVPVSQVCDKHGVSVVDYVRKWSEKTDINVGQIQKGIGVWSSTYCSWVKNYGRVYEHNGWIPRDHWLDDWEKLAILQYHFDHPLAGYRRLTYMMLDANVVACSAATVYRVLSDAGLLRRNQQRSSKGTGFQQPLVAHEHWHINISYLNIAGTFYFMATILDGFSRSIVHWDSGVEKYVLEYYTLRLQSASAT